MRTLIDAAAWLFWGPPVANEKQTKPILRGIVLARVDDLRCCGDEMAEKAFMAIGAELGFGSIEYDNFTWCGKRIRRCKEDGSIRLSMEEYHRNLRPIYLPKSRKSEPSSP